MDQYSVYYRFQLQNYYFKKNLNIFGRMEISETIYEDVLKPSYKN